MNVIAIIGPLTAPAAAQRQRHIDAAEALAFEVWRLGVGAYCAHQMTGHRFGQLPEAIFLTGHLDMARRCDAGLLVDGWPQSKGSLTEKAALEAQGKPVFETLAALQTWLATKEQTVCP